MVEVEHGPGDLGIGRHELAGLRLGGDLSLEDRVAEDLHEDRGELGVFAFPERLEVEVGELGEAQEEVRADRAAVVLDEIQVARGDPEPFRQGGLGEAFTKPQGTYAFAQMADRFHSCILQ